MIHPLGQAHLDAQKACHDAHDKYLAAIKSQFGPKANTWTHDQKLWNLEVAKAYSAFRNTQTNYINTLDAMRRANVTVHPI